MKAPHQPATPATRHEDALADVPLPRGPSFDEEDVSDKPGWVSDNPPLGTEQKQYMEELHRKRLQSMLAVDDMIGDLVDSLRKSNELDDTYIFFASDNGFHLDQHRLGAGKWTAYEEDIRVPLVVRGPGVPEGQTLPHMVLNNDLAPTFADLAGAKIPPFVDGRSLKTLLDREPTPPTSWPGSKSGWARCVSARAWGAAPPRTAADRVDLGKVPGVEGDRRERVR